MRLKKSIFIAASFLGLVLAGRAQGTAFTYQGRLNSGGGPANGGHDLVFAVYDTNAPAGNLVARPVTNSAVAVSNGLFTVTLDFGAGVFTGNPRWLEIAVRTNGGSTFTTLAPRQPLTPTPYAIMANSASNLLGTLPAAQLSGTIPAGQISGVIPSGDISGTYGNAVSFNNGADTFDGTFVGQFFGGSFTGGIFTGSFFGNGSGLYGLTDSQLPGNVAFLNSNQVFTAQNVFAQGIGIGNPNPLFSVDALAGQAVGRFVTTNSPNGAVIELWNTLTNNSEYLGAINFHSANSYAGQIGYAAGNPTNQNNDVMQFRVAQTLALTLQADSRGSGAASLVGGYPGNAVSSSTSGGDVIAGGGYPLAPNLVLTNSSGVFIGAGSDNQIGPNVNDSVIVGGYGGVVQDWDSVIVGGYFNTNLTAYGFIGGGSQNLIQNNVWGGFIGGGTLNTILTGSGYSAIPSGYQNTISSNNSYTVIGGGYQNSVQPGAGYSFIGSGLLNSIQSNAWVSVIAGGEANVIGANATWSFIGSGYNNSVDGWTNSPAYIYGSSIIGGVDNHIYSFSYYALIGGGSGNSIQAGSQFGVIAGGTGNAIQTNSPQSFIGGGALNIIQANDFHTVIGGGALNIIQANAHDSVIAGGYDNFIQTGANNGFIGGGYTNTILTYAQFTTIAGGVSNNAAGYGGAVPGGFGNSANGLDSFAAGTFAQATNDGAFVLTDSGLTNFYSTTSNQLSARFTGGIRFVTGGAGMTVDGQPVVSGGNYPAVVTLTNAGNTFGGNGAGLTNVNAATLNGLPSSAYAPASGSPNYIDNQSLGFQNASFQISGSAIVSGAVSGGILIGASAIINNTLTAGGSITGTNAQFTGLIRSGSETGTSEAPNPAGLVIRRVNSTAVSSNLVVAVSRVNGNTTNVALVRDGTVGGFVIQYPALAIGRLTIACLGMDSTGAQKNFYTTITAPVAAGIVQIYNNTQNIVHFECTFGDTYNSTALTEVTLSRANGDNFWSGNVLSTVNQ
ncbi:MAG: hypothetical protein P4N60_15565 [Verrucomicrobiae bacterium]|nr:hypothetical protein [Verrucomicrobiae bacterium]